MTMTCNLCQGDKPFTVPCGDGIGEALMADHMAADHDEHGPARKLSALRRARTPAPVGINELAWDSHDRYYAD